MTHTAKLYGGSLYELAVQEKLTEIIKEQMEQIRILFRENPEYIRLLSEPSIPKEERYGLVEEAFGSQAERYLVNFIKLLCERSILREYGGCCDEFTRRYNEDHGIVEATVTSAVVLNSQQMEALKIRLEKLSGKEVSLIQKKDATILAGLRVEMAGKQLDGTVQGRLAGISQKLKETME